MTGGIKIPISGDLSGLHQAVEDFGQKAKKVFGELNGSAKIDTSAAKQGLQDLEKAVHKINAALQEAASKDMGGKAIDGMASSFDQAVKHAKALEQAVGNAGNKGTTAFNKAVAETRKLITEMEKARRLQAAMAKHGQSMSLGQASELEKDFQFIVKQQSGAKRKRLEKFGDLGTLSNNWRDLASNEVGARRQYREILQQLGVNGQNDPRPGGPQRTFSQFVGGSLRRAGSGMLGAVTPGAGVGGSIMGQAAQEASAAPGGLLSGAGMGRLLAGGMIGALAFGAIKGAGAIMGKARSSEEESIGYTDLHRQMGDTASSFDDLRNAVRSSAKQLDMTFGAGSKMAENYVKGGMLDGINAKDLGKELVGAGGFSRALGLDPEAGAGMFATLRKNKVTTGDGDNKRFALMIGEAVARAGVFSKADDVLASVASYTQQATRASLSPANAEGFLGGMGNLMALKMPGLDPSASSSLIGKADSAIRGTGGEAARNYFLGMMQRQMPGMSQVDVGFLHDTGAFGTATQAFGENSPAMTAAKERGDTALMEKYRRFAKQGGDTTNLDRVMGGMSGMSTDDMRKNLMGYMGMNDSEAAAMIAAYSRNGDMSSAVNNLGKYGINTKTLNSGSIRNMIDIEYGDDDQLGSKAKKLRTQNLSSTESKALDAAEASGDIGELKSVMIKLASTRGMDMTQGDESRKNMTNLDNMASDIATKLIPMTNAIREAVSKMAGVFGYKDTYGNSEKAKSELEASLSSVPEGDDDGRRKVYQSELDKVNKNPGNYSAEYRKMVTNGATDKNLQSNAAMINAPSQYDAELKKAASKYGVNWRDLKQLAVQESGLNPNATNVNGNGTTDRGLMQLNSKYDDERGVTDPFDVGQNIDAGARTWADALRRAGGDKRTAFRMYNGKGERADKYADRSMALHDEAEAHRPISSISEAWSAIADHVNRNGAPIPPGQSTSMAPATAAQKVAISGEFYLKDKNTGRELASPAQVSGISAPRAAGVR